MQMMNEPGYMVADTDGMRGWDGSEAHVRSFYRTPDELVVLFFDGKQNLVAHFIYRWKLKPCSIYIDNQEAAVFAASPFAKG
jgi:hypothetical protein